MVDVGIIATKRWVINLINGVLKKKKVELTEEHKTNETLNGRPVYEKLFTFSQIAVPSNAWTNTPVSRVANNIDFCITAFASNSNNQSWQPVLVLNSQDVIQIINLRSVQLSSVDALLLKYTKTTD